jgi:alpha-methylacyl-CoA racemase
MSGPLEGYRVVELAGLGPAPFAAMLLADLGADVVRVDRPNASTPAGRGDVVYRGRRSIAIDVKEPQGREVVLDLAGRADAFIEPFRPGVAERLGIGPDECFDRNRRLVYGRMTGWGQEGPLAARAGHDIDYIALAGALWPLGTEGEPPVPPLNLVGDFGGGGMLLAVGVLAALLETQRSGTGQVVDAAMVDGAALLMTFIWGMREIGVWSDRRSANPLDGAAPYYRSYACADERYVAVGAMEPQFYAALVRLTGLADEAPLPDQLDQSTWPDITDRLARIFRTRSRDEWCELAEGIDACLAPVLDFEEARNHPHNVVRGTFTEVDGVSQPAPAPRFARTPASISGPVALPGEHTDDVLSEWLARDADEIANLRAAGAVV